MTTGIQLATLLIRRCREGSSEETLRTLVTALPVANEPV